VEFYTGDILVPDTLKEVFKGIDTVIHLVGIIKEIKAQHLKKFILKDKECFRGCQKCRIKEVYTYECTGDKARLV
jgi:hypothetical protein